MLNPAAGRERQWGTGSLRMVPAGEARRIVVVGGGPAGMRTAATAARRGPSLPSCSERETASAGI